MKYCASTRAVTDLPTPPFSPPMKLMELMRFLREWEETAIDSRCGAGLDLVLSDHRHPACATPARIAPWLSGARAEGTGWPPPLMSPGLRPPPLLRCGGHPAPSARVPPGGSGRPITA